MNKSTGYRPGIPQQPYSKWDTEKDEVEVDYKQMADGKGTTWFSGSKGIVLKVLLVLVIFSLGLIIGYIVRRSVHEVFVMPKHKCPYLNGQEGYSTDLSERLRRDILAKGLEEKLKSYTRKIHVTGTKENIVVGKLLQDQLREYNLKIKVSTYKPLLSYQESWKAENSVYLLDSNGTAVMQMKYKGPHEKFHPEIGPYSAYAPNGTVQGELVYANYGQEKDFEQLQSYNVDCENSIVIMRIGKLYRGEKVSNAMKFGAAGVLLYADPAEVTSFHSDSDTDVYPHTWETPGWAVMRGSVIPELLGDPLTPGLPSIEGMYRLPISEANLPSIPVQPISYNDAEHLMKHMTGPVVQDFHGSLHRNVTYAMGPGYSDERAGFQVRMTVKNEMEKRDIHNIFGIIDGQEEPDRYVIVGCHYDAWTYGATDPNSGTSVLMEVAKAFGGMVERGWQPRRTIIFAHWDAEEQALIGSYEWVEEHMQELSERTVAYINLDMAVQGNYTLAVSASPLLRDLTYRASQMVKPAIPDNQSTSLFGQWSQRAQLDGAGKPSISYVGSGTDHAPFVFLLGVPAVWPRYTYNSKQMQMKGIPSYHTGMDKFEYVKEFVDPSFSAHKSLADLVGEMTLQLSSSTKLPMDAREFAKTLKKEFDALQNSLETLHESDSQPVEILVFLEKAINDFNTSAVNFMDKFRTIDTADVLHVSRMNDRLMQLSRSFIHSEGLPGRPMYKNILFAPSAVNSYGHSTFTGIHDAFTLYGKAPSENKPKLAQILEKQISIATLAIQSARRILCDIAVT